jgi:hypothetical protein
MNIIDNNSFIETNILCYANFILDMENFEKTSWQTDSPMSSLKSW